MDDAAIALHPAPHQGPHEEPHDTADAIVTTGKPEATNPLFLDEILALREMATIYFTITGEDSRLLLQIDIQPRPAKPIEKPLGPAANPDGPSRLQDVPEESPQSFGASFGLSPGRTMTTSPLPPTQAGRQLPLSERDESGTIAKNQRRRQHYGDRTDRAPKSQRMSSDASFGHSEDIDRHRCLCLMETHDDVIECEVASCKV
jgi:hypothetical protein